MKSFKQYLEETKKIVKYHGGNYYNPSKSHDSVNFPEKLSHHNLISLTTKKYDLHANLEPHEYDSMRKYTASSSDLNGYHYKKHKDPDHKPFVPSNHTLESYKSKLNTQTEHLDSAIKKHKLDKPLTTYRGVSFHPGEEAAKHLDRHIHAPGFSSASLSSGIAERFSGHGQNEQHVLIIHSKKGHHVLPILGHSVLGNGDEQEILHPRHTIMKIGKTPAKTITHHYTETYYDIDDKPVKTPVKTNVHYWNAHVVHQEAINEKL